MNKGTCVPFVTSAISKMCQDIDVYSLYGMCINVCVDTYVYHSTAYVSITVINVTLDVRDIEDNM